MPKPRILIPTPIQDNEKLRFTMRANYVRSVIVGGGVPLLVPVSIDLDSLHELYADSDGVLLTGGDDVDPARFDEAPHEKTAGIDLLRDEVEIQISQWAAQDDKPLFAICRGIQVLNVALGGSLVQDIPSQCASPLTHNGNYYGPRRDEVHHTVWVEPDSHLAGILGSGDVGTNSFHHQAAGRIAPGLVVTARSSDGVVEAVEMPGRRFLLGVQWHPEEMTLQREDMQRLFSEFVAAALVREPA